MLEKINCITLFLLVIIFASSSSMGAEGDVFAIRSDLVVKYNAVLSTADNTPSSPASNFTDIALNQSTGKGYAASSDGTSSWVVKFTNDTPATYDGSSLTLTEDFRALAVYDASNTVYAVAQNRLFSFSGDDLSIIASSTPLSGYSFQDIAVNQTTGDIYAMSWNGTTGQIVKYDSNFTIVDPVNDILSYAGFDFTSIDIDQKTGDVYAADGYANGNSRVTRFSANLVSLGISFVYPNTSGVDFQGVAINQSTHEVYASSPSGHIKRFNSTLTFLNELQNPGNYAARGFLGLDTNDTTGDVYVAGTDGMVAGFSEDLTPFNNSYTYGSLTGDIVVKQVNLQGDVFAPRSDLLVKYNAFLSTAVNTPSSPTSNFTDIALNQSTGKSYVTSSNGTSSSVVKFNYGTLHVSYEGSSLSLTEDFRAIAVHDASNTVYAVAQDRLFSFSGDDLSTIASSTSLSGYSFQDIAVNQKTGDIYAMSWDGTTGKIVKYNSSLIIVDPINDILSYTGFDFTSIDINQKTGDVYAADGYANGYSRITRFSANLVSLGIGFVYPNTSGVDFQGVAINQSTHEVYASSPSGHIKRFDSFLAFLNELQNPGNYATRGFLGLDINDTTGNIYVAGTNGMVAGFSENLTPFNNSYTYGSLTGDVVVKQVNPQGDVFAPRSDLIVMYSSFLSPAANTPSSPDSNFTDIALNQSTGKGYVTSSDGTSSWIDKFTSYTDLDGPLHGSLHIIHNFSSLSYLGLDFRAVAVHDANNTVYVAAEDRLVALNGDYLGTIASSLPLPGFSFQDIAVNQTTGDIYAMSWNGTTGQIVKYDSNFTIVDPVNDILSYTGFDFTSIDIDQTTGDVYAADGYANGYSRITRFSANLVSLGVSYIYPSASGVDFKGVAVNQSTHEVYASSPSGHVKRFNSTLTLLNELQNPANYAARGFLGLDINDTTGDVYVAGAGGMVAGFSEDLTPFNNSYTYGSLTGDVVVKQVNLP